MRIKTDYRFGDPKLNEWSGVYGYNPDDPSIFEKYGEMFAIVRIKAQVDDLDLEKIAKMMIEELQHHYFNEGDSYSDLLEKLESSAWKMKSKMDFLLSREPEVLEKGIDLEMAITVIKDKFLYCLVIGESQIYIKREEKIIEISKALIDKNSSGLFKSGSLELLEGDKIALLTSKVIADQENFYDSFADLNLDILNGNAFKAGASVMYVADENAEWNYSKAIVENEPIEEALSEDAHEETAENLNEENDVEEIENFEEDINLGQQEIKNDQDEHSEIANIANKFVETKDNFVSKAKNLTKDKKFVSKNSLEKIKTLLSSFKEKVENHFANNQSTYASIINKFTKYIRNFFKNINLLFKREVLGIGGNRRLSADKQRLKRNRLIFAGLIAVLTLFLFFSIRNLSSHKKEEEAMQNDQEKIAEFQSSLDTLLAQTNVTTLANLQKRSELLTNYGLLDDEIDQYLKQSQLKDELNVIKSSIKEQKNTLNLQQSFTQPQIIADLGSQFTDANLSDIEYANGSLFISDEARNVIYKTATEINSTVEAHITNVVQPMILVKNTSNEIVFYDKNDGSSVGKFNTDTKDSITRFPSLTRANIGNVEEAAIYDGNNALYEIHTNHKQIFKRDDLGAEYAGGGALYSSENPPNWKTDEILSKAIDIEAPFEVYVLIQNGGLKRYLGGEENTINDSTFINLLPQDLAALNNATALDVSLNYLVIGDSINQRVLLFKVQDNPEKRLEFIKQFKYVGEQNIFTQIKELVINEASKEIYVLDGAKVIRLDFNE